MLQEEGILISLLLILAGTIGFVVPQRAHASIPARIFWGFISLLVFVGLIWANQEFKASHNDKDFAAWTLCNLGVSSTAACKSKPPEPVPSEQSTNPNPTPTLPIASLPTPASTTSATPAPAPAPVPTTPQKPTIVGRWTGVLNCGGGPLKFALDLSLDNADRLYGDFSYFALNESVSQVQGKLHGEYDRLTDQFALSMGGYEFDPVYPQIEALRGTFDSFGRLASGSVYLNDKRCGRLKLAKGKDVPEF